MAEQIVKEPIERISAVNIVANDSNHNDVKIEVMDHLKLQQVAAWPDTLTDIKALVEKTIGSGLSFSAIAVDGNALAIWTEPLKFWLINSSVSSVKPEQGAILDLSHSLTHLRLSGVAAADHLNKHLPLDLREAKFPVGATAASAIHHVGVRLWRQQDGYHLLIPRSFAQSVYELLL